jgi:hypothetical protein
MYTFDVAWVTMMPVTSARLVAQNGWKVNETGLRHENSPSGG